MMAILFFWILPVLRLTAAEVTCEFPDFLQSAEDNGELQAWNTRRWWLHLRQKPKWAEKQEVYVKGSHMWRHREQSLNCKKGHQRRSYPFPFSGLGKCSEKYLVYNRTCISVQGNTRYRVLQYNNDRTHHFTCMKFVRRSDNVVQVYEGPVSDSNNDDLCDDENLSLDEWPWVAPWLNRPYYCPIEGGFTFRSIRRLTHEDICEKEWRLSHLEIECVRGDGLHFMAPAGSTCNPFDKDDHIKTLNCWAGWEEGDYIFLVAADRSEPRYCLRFPKYQAGEFSVLVYFSVICPTENDGKPPHGIEYYELRMQRKDPFSCRDESVLECQAVAANKLCAREEGFAPHCPRSCQLCAPPPEGENQRSRCAFHLRLYGDWVLYEAERTEDVFIDQDSLEFSHLGTFHCHKVLLEDSVFRYKTVSIFRNGCGQRFTCFEFKRRYNNVLQYRVGKSFRREGEEDSMCVFKHDPMPLGNRFRSEDFKNLILARDLWPSYCGLKSNIRFNGTVNGEQCEGELGDYSPDTCTTRGTVILRSGTCASLLIPLEFQCLDFFPADENSMDIEERLITRSMDGKNEYNCWIISSYIDGTWMPHRVMYRMPTPQCTRENPPGVGPELMPKAVLHLDDKTKNKMCIPDLRLSTLPPSTLSTLYVPFRDNASTKDPRGSSQRPQADGSSPTLPSGLSQGASRGCRPSFTLSCLLCVFVLVVWSRLSSAPCVSLTNWVLGKR